MNTQIKTLDWRKTTEKVFQIVGEIAIALAASQILEGKFNPMFLAIAGLLHAILDIMRHTEKK